MHKRVLAVEQFDWLSATRQAAPAAGMGLRTGKMWALSAAGWIGADRALNVGTTDTKAAVLCVYFVEFERVMFACSLFCHTFPAQIDLVSKGGEGVAGAVRPAFYNTFCRRKFMRIAQGEQAPAEALTVMPAGSRKNKKGGRAAVLVIGAVPVLLWRKSLLAREKDSGAICAVRLTKHGAAAEQFTPGMQLECTAITNGLFEYDGGAPLTLTPTHTHE